MRIDFHSHILPGIDDGARNVEQSLKLIDMLKNDGVDVIVATPHLYLHKESADSFLKKRDEAVLTLREAIKGKEYPKILIGAEVYFSTALLDSDIPLDRLCIENTDYLLLELPYQNFSSTLLNSISDFINYSGRKIILAHIERYMEFFSGNGLKEILSHELLAQFNCDSLERMSERRKTMKLIRDGLVHIMGSDAHHPVNRPPLYGMAEGIIKKKLSSEEFKAMAQMAEAVLLNKSVSDVLSLR